jgi:hypothetical protein
MSKIVVLILICHLHRSIDLILTFFNDFVISLSLSEREDGRRRKEKEWLEITNGFVFFVPHQILKR